jgi:YhcH/YjgK/YiaL family protein
MADVVLDEIANASLYFALGPRIRKALEFIRSTPLSALPVGRQAIDGDTIVASVADYTTKDEAAGRWEAHRTHIDIQTVISGEELIGVAPLASLRAEPYDDIQDILFASGQGDVVTLTAGRFVVLFPHDAHMPGLRIGAPAPVRKLVIKIRC